MKNIFDVIKDVAKKVFFPGFSRLGEIIHF